MLVAQLCLTLCVATDCSPPVSSVHDILRARILEWIAIPFSRGSSRPRNQNQVCLIAAQLAINIQNYFIFYIMTAAAAAAKSLQLCPTLCDPRWSLKVKIEFYCQTLSLVSSFSDTQQGKVLAALNYTSFSVTPLQSWFLFSLILCSLFSFTTLRFLLLILSKIFSSPPQSLSSLPIF